MRRAFNTCTYFFSCTQSIIIIIANISLYYFTAGQSFFFFHTFLPLISTFDVSFPNASIFHPAMWYKPSLFFSYFSHSLVYVNICQYLCYINISWWEEYRNSKRSSSSRTPERLSIALCLGSLYALFLGSNENYFGSVILSICIPVVHCFWIFHFSIKLYTTEYGGLNPDPLVRDFSLRY